MVTSRTPEVRRRHAVRWIRGCLNTHFVSGTSDGAEKHWPRITGAGVVLAVLVGLTTLVVACVSIWWVPAYLSLMVFIFVIPHGRSRCARGEESTDGNLAQVGQGLRVDCADKEDHHHLTAQSVAGLAESELKVESQVLHSDSTRAQVAKPRRTRTRAQQVDKNDR